MRRQAIGVTFSLLLLFQVSVEVVSGFAGIANQYHVGFTSQVSCQQQQQQQRRIQGGCHKSGLHTAVLLLAASSSNNSGGSSDDLDTFMASLQSRVEELRDPKLPLVVLDSMLPRQVLKIKVSNRTFLELVRTRLAQEEPFFGMTGLARLSNGQQVHLKTGATVHIVGKPQVEPDGNLLLVLRAEKMFRIKGSVENHVSGGWTEARVEYLENLDDEEANNVDAATTTTGDRLGLARAMAKSRQLPGLVSEWVELARQRERQPGQLDRLLIDLEVMPPAHLPSERALWVGALINPLPALGVALEIRPALLTAQTPEQRVDVALQGIEKSIRHMRGEPL